MASRETLVGNLRIVGATSAAGQVLPLLAMPWMTRLYGPAAFGVFGLFFATAMTLSLVASGRYEMRVPVAHDDDEAARLVVGSLGVLAIVTASVALCCRLAWTVLGVPYSTWPIWLGAGCVLSAGAVQSFNCWFTRREQFGALSAARLLQAILTAAASVTLGYWTPEPWGLALGAVLGQSGGALLAMSLAAGPVHRAWKARGFDEIIRTLKDHLEYPRVNAPHALLDGVRESGFQGAFALIFGPAANGLYSLSARVLRMPASFVASSIGQVLFGQLAKDAREGSDSRNLIWRAVSTVAGLAALPFLAIALSGPELFSFVFGEEWRGAGTYAQIMAPALWLGLAIAPVSSMPVVSGKLRVAFLVALADLAVRAVALAAGAAAGNERSAIAILTVGSSVTYVGLLAWYHRLATRSSHRKIVFIGQTRWCRLLSEQLTHFPAASVKGSFAAVGLDRPWSILSASSIINVLGADVLVRVGFRPEGDTPFGRMFAAAWRVLRALRPGQATAMYWIGTDVTQSKRMLERGRNRERFARAVRTERHIAASPGLVQELNELEVSAELVWFPAMTLKVPEKVPAMPERFTVLSYVPDARALFYGGPQLASLARSLPDIEVRIAGGEGRWIAERPPNLKFLGWVKEMEFEYSRCNVVVRLVAHDALGATAIEGLLFGRHVIYSSVLQDSVRVAFDDSRALIEAVEGIRRLHKDPSLPSRQGVADRAKEVFDQHSRLQVLWNFLDGLR